MRKIYVKLVSLLSVIFTHMGRKKLVKRFVLLLLLVTCIIGIVILANWYVKSTSEQLSRLEVDIAKGDSYLLGHLDKDPELVELEKEIDYILRLYKGDNQSNLALNLDVDQIDVKGLINHRVENHFFENEREKVNRKVKLQRRLQFPHARETPRIVPQKKFKYRAKRRSKSVPGLLNAHIWEGWCGLRVEDLKREKHFPLYPSFKTHVNLAFAQWNEVGYGERIFGYLHPPETGDYIFAVSCDDNCEIWLSNSSDPKYIHKIAYVGTLNIPANTKLDNFRQYQSQISIQVYLKAGHRYYMEALHKQAAYKDHLLLTWLAPSWPRVRTISSKYISSFISADLETVGVEDYAAYIPETKATFIGEQIYNDVGNIYYFNGTKYKFGSEDTRYSNVSSQFVDSADFTNVLPSMDYKPSYVLDFTPKRYEGVELVHESSVYPNDNTVLTHMYAYEDCWTHRYNYPHMRKVYLGNSVKTSMDGEHLFSQLSFDEKFKYVTKLYSTTIKRISKKYGIPKVKDADNSDFESKTKSLIEVEKVLRKSNPSEAENTKIDHDTYSDIDNVHSMLSKDKSNEKETPIAANESSDAFNVYRGRKLLSFQYEEGDVKENKAYHTKDKQTNYLKYFKEKPTEDSVNTRYNINVKPRSLRKGSSYDVDNDVLSANLLENNIPRKPISILQFVNDNHLVKDRNSNLSNMEDPNVIRATKKKKYKMMKRNQYIPKRQKVSPTIHKKIYFRDGVIINSTRKAEEDKVRLYDVFGPAVYRLSQVPKRRFLWIYNQDLSACKTDGNLQLSEEIAVQIVHDYMQEVKRKHGSKYSLRRIVNVEENHDIVHGDRYLIEVDLNVKNEKQPKQLSIYVFKPLGSTKLFEINNFKWYSHSTVHIIIPVKDQGRWVKHFISNMERIYKSSKDQYLNIIIVDFNSTDIDIEKSLKKSKLPRYKVISLDGAFQRALGIQAGADTVKNPNDIIFACDLHLEIPAHLITSIRKHTIKEKMTFAPIVFRLSCGYTPELPFGLWEIHGYGLFAISKFDFDRIGGMNTEEFKTKWGGEDWEFLDRTLAFGLQVERMRVAQFYHYYHSKKRMWIAPKPRLPPIVNVGTL